MAQETPLQELDRMLKGLMEKDLRIQCRARGVSPAGNKEVLRDRLKEVMIQTNDFTLRKENGEVADGAAEVVAGAHSDNDNLRNNFSRPGGQQNVGNFLTGRNSSRVLQRPGGTSTIQLG